MTIRDLAKRNGWTKEDVETLLHQLGIPLEKERRSPQEAAKLELALHYPPIFIAKAIQRFPEVFNLPLDECSDLLECYWFASVAMESGDEQVWGLLLSVYTQILISRPRLKLRFWEALDTEAKKRLIIAKAG